MLILHCAILACGGGLRPLDVKESNALHDGILLHVRLIDYQTKTTIVGFCKNRVTFLLTPMGVLAPRMYTVI